jgi:hypothetical protein
MALIIVFAEWQTNIAQQNLITELTVAYQLSRGTQL